ncbi:hypothetical protein H4582DRAFT_1907887 [Lactarius indigo]|nr:hypothetical protein H4582DRAFT_1907887 [Lactarius indigo]
MEIDLYVPSFRTASKRIRSHSPTPCEHDRPLKRLSLAVNDRTCDSPLSFQSPHTASPASPARAQSLSTVLLVQKPTQSVCMLSAEADAGVQDEQWVALTRNLTLLPAQCPTEHETTWSSNGENTMNLDETPRPSTRLCSHPQGFQCEQSKIHTTDNTTPSLLHSDACSSMPKVLSPRLTLPPVTVTGHLQIPDPVTIPTPPIVTAILPPHSPFSSGCVNIMSLHFREPQPSQQQQTPPRRSRFTMGPRPGCEKCRLGVPGHYAHFD